MILNQLWNAFILSPLIKHLIILISMHLLKLEGAIINIDSEYRTTLRQDSKQGENCTEVQLYRINDGLSMGTVFSTIKKIITKNAKMKHRSVVYYESVEYVKSRDIPLKQILPGEYLALVRINQPLFKIKWKLITLKEKVGYMLAIAGALQMLHAKKRAYLLINLEHIYTTLKKQIKIASVYDEQIAIIVGHVTSSPSFMNEDHEMRMRFDIWCLAIVFIQILINGRLKITWEQPNRTLNSIKTLLKYSHHIIFYSLRSIITKMLRDENQIDIGKIVRKLKQLSRLQQRQLITRQWQSKKMILPLVAAPKATLPHSQVAPMDQRIIVIDIYQLFLTFCRQSEQLFIELTNPDLERPLMVATYTLESLPQNIRTRYKTMAAFFHYVQDLDPGRFRLTKEGGLHIRRS